MSEKEKKNGLENSILDTLNHGKEMINSNIDRIESELNNVLSILKDQRFKKMNEKCALLQNIANAHKSEIENKGDKDEEKQKERGSFKVDIVSTKEYSFESYGIKGLFNENTDKKSDKKWIVNGTYIDGEKEIKVEPVYIKDEKGLIDFINRSNLTINLSKNNIINQNNVNEIITTDKHSNRLPNGNIKWVRELLVNVKPEITNLKMHTLDGKISLGNFDDTEFKTQAFNDTKDLDINSENYAKYLNTLIVQSIAIPQPNLAENLDK